MHHLSDRPVAFWDQPCHRPSYDSPSARGLPGPSGEIAQSAWHCLWLGTELTRSIHRQVPFTHRRLPVTPSPVLLCFFVHTVCRCQLHVAHQAAITLGLDSHQPRTVRTGHLDQSTMPQLVKHWGAQSNHSACRPLWTTVSRARRVRDFISAPVSGILEPRIYGPEQYGFPKMQS